MPVEAVRNLIRRWPGTIIFVLCVFLAATVLIVDQQRESATCRQLSSNREVLQTLVIEATAGGGANLDFSRIPGFEDLEPQDQIFWSNVGRALASSGDSGARERLLRTVPDIEC